MDDDEEGDNDHEMHEILHDLFPMTSMEGSMGERERERERESEPEPKRDLNREKRNDKKNFDDLVKDVDQKLYHNYKYNKLSCLFPQEELLPKGNILLKKHHDVKYIMNKLGSGLGPNQEDNYEDEFGNEGVYKMRRVYKGGESMKDKTHLMKWHHLERLKDGKLRHPDDALSWKHFDKKHPEFASNHQNVSFALTSDGFNIYRGVKTVVGWFNTFDASTNQNFQMKVAVNSTICDFPGYANISEWSTKG
ncbi:hypothetical protein Tco_1299770 [Tanacetum coccineum]